MFKLNYFGHDFYVDGIHQDVFTCHNCKVKVHYSNYFSDVIYFENCETLNLTCEEIQIKQILE